MSGCEGGYGKGAFEPVGVGGGAGHGGRGGKGYYKGSYSAGGIVYGNTTLPCEFGSGSGSGNATFGDDTAGGGIIGPILLSSLSCPLAFISPILSCLPGHRHREPITHLSSMSLNNASNIHTQEST